MCTKLVNSFISKKHPLRYVFPAYNDIYNGTEYIIDIGKNTVYEMSVS